MPAPRPTWLRYDVNAFGAPVSVHRCWACGNEFPVCPAVSSESDAWDGCLATTCPTYDPGRDADLLFANEPERIGRRECS